MISTINKKLLPMKGHYFFFNGGTAPVIPFLPVIARHLGFSGTIVGIIYTVLPIVGMIVKPVLGGIADRYKSKKLLFIIFQIIMAIALLGINYISEIPKISKVHFSCEDGFAVFDTSVTNRVADNCIKSKILASVPNQKSFKCQLSCEELNPNMQDIVCNDWDPEHKLNYCLNNTNTLEFTSIIVKDHIEVFQNVTIFKVGTIQVEGNNVSSKCSKGHISTICDIKCDLVTVNEYIEVPRSQEYQVLTEYQFWVFSVLAIFGWGGMAVVVSIGDAICFEMLGDRPNLFGYQRLWGSVGWGIFSIIAGFMVDAYSGGQSKKDYTSVFYLMLAMIIVDVVISTRLQYVQEHMSSNIFRDVAKVLSRIRVVVYLLWCVFVGACTGFIWNFLFWHLEDIARQYDNTDGGCHMHLWIKTLEGLVMGIQCIGGELPFFFLSGWILKRIGHVHCMSIVLLGIGVRYILYSVLVDPWWVLPVELLNGITFGLFYATMASYASIAAPPGTEATVQGLVGAVFEGVGVSLGSLIGGILFDAYGGWITFRIFGVASIICCALHVLVQYFLERKVKLPNDSEFSAFATTQYKPPKEAIRILHDEPQEFTLMEQ